MRLVKRGDSFEESNNSSNNKSAMNINKGDTFKTRSTVTELTHMATRPTLTMLKEEGRKAAEPQE